MKHWIALLLSAASLGLQAAAPAPRTLAEWTFDKPGDFQGWQPNGQVSNAVVAAGELAFATTGDDPILELRPRLDVPASARQYLEVRLKADRDGEAGFG